MARSVKKGPFVDGHLMKKSDCCQRDEKQQANQNLVTPQRGVAGYDRIDVQRSQWPSVCTGFRNGKPHRLQTW